MNSVTETKKGRIDWDWLIPLIRNLMEDRFTGSIRINFHQGRLSRKVEKTTFISEK